MPACISRSSGGTIVCDLRREPALLGSWHVLPTNLPLAKAGPPTPARECPGTRVRGTGADDAADRDARVPKA